MREQFKDYLTFSRTERGGILLLITILFMVVAVNIYMSEFIKGNGTNINGFEKEITEFLERQKAYSDSVNNIRADSVKNIRSDSVQVKYPPRHEKKIYTYKPKTKNNNATIVIDINTADTLEFQKLRGIGPYYASMIVKYRSLLGGFIKKEQLLEVYGMDSARYELFIENITLQNDSVIRFDLNRVAFRDLLRHPYFDYYLVKDIFNLRQKRGDYKNVSDLMELELMYEELYEQISPYLFVDTIEIIDY